MWKTRIGKLQWCFNKSCLQKIHDLSTATSKFTGNKHIKIIFHIWSISQAPPGSACRTQRCVSSRARLQKAFTVALASMRLTKVCSVWYKTCSVGSGRCLTYFFLLFFLFAERNLRCVQVLFLCNVDSVEMFLDVSELYIYICFCLCFKESTSMVFKSPSRVWR